MTDRLATDDALLEELRGLPHFKGVPAALLSQIAQGCRFVNFDRDAWIFHQGQVPRAFFHVVAGGVRLLRAKSDGREQVVHRLRPGQSFAEAALMNLHAYPVHAQATVTPTRLLEVGAEPLLELFDNEPRLARAMVASLSSRLVRLVQRIDDLLVPHVETRLARYLLDQCGTAGPDGVTVQLPMPKKDLAAFLGIAPETLSRQFKRWRDAGLVTSVGGAVLIHDLDALLAVTHD